VEPFLLAELLLVLDVLFKSLLKADVFAIVASELLKPGNVLREFFHNMRLLIYTCEFLSLLLKQEALFNCELA